MLYVERSMENMDPRIEMDRDTTDGTSRSPPGLITHQHQRRSKKDGRDRPVFTLDTHAMAYKLLMSDDRGDDEVDEQDAEKLSDHGKEARMDFYQNRSRSEGASAIMKSCLREMRQKKESSLEYEDDEEEEETAVDSQKDVEEATTVDEQQRRIRRRSSTTSSCENPRKKSSVPANLASLAKETTVVAHVESESKLEPPEPKMELLKRAPLAYIPAVDSSSDLLSMGNSNRGDRRRLFSENRFVPYFSLPSPTFVLHCLLDERKVCLETISSSATGQLLEGTILIKRSPTPGADDRRRRVFARTTPDQWTTHEDVQAEFDGQCRERANVDRFRIRIECDRPVQSGARLELALAYEMECTDGRTVSYWDNNGGANYAFWYSA